jgi:hypothetical protein
MKISVPDAAALLEHAVNAQVSSLRRLRDDLLELTARPEWAKMCRSISLGSTAPGMPDLWLEVAPRVLAAHQAPDQRCHFTAGVQAETRIVPNETARLSIPGAIGHRSS